MNLAKQLDGKDLLAMYREQFYLPKNTIYFDGNSLGLLSKSAERTTLDMLNSWKEFGIEGWTTGQDPWFYLPEKIGALMAPLVGARESEVVAGNSTTVNLHQLLATFYKPQGRRTKIIIEELAFPTDIYAIKSHLALHGKDIENDLILIKSRDGYTISENDILAEFNDDIALIILPVVLYRSGQKLNVERITKAAHQHHILVGFDGCHSVGSVEHHLHEHQVDFAFWCTYKYLNGGPGSVAGLFVHEKHLGTKPGLAGWFSSRKDKQFNMSSDLDYADTAGAYQMGTPQILSLAGLLGSLELFEKVGMSQLRKKSLQLTKFLRELVEEELTEFGVTVVTPKNENEHGGHIAIRHPNAIPISQLLRRNGVIPDFRPPDIIRLAPSAFYTSFEDVHNAVQILKSILLKKEYLMEKQIRDIVT